jgi:uncharacterized membrane protein
MEAPLPQKLTTQSWKYLVWFAAGALLIAWLIETPPGLLGKMDAIAYSVCHRIASRSFFLEDRALPLCARCTGMYMGALVGLAYQARGGRNGAFPSWKMAIPFVLFAGAFAFDGVNSYLHLFPGAPGLYAPTNLLRLVTGTGMGLAMAAVLAPAFRQTMWKDWIPQPALARFSQLGGLLLFAAGVDLLVWTGNPLILYPIALISSLGVMVLLSLIYTMVLVMLFKKENHFESFRALTLYLVGGFTIALLQISLLDLGRFLLTGTWAGFNF